MIFFRKVFFHCCFSPSQKTSRPLAKQKQLISHNVHDVRIYLGNVSPSQTKHINSVEKQKVSFCFCYLRKFRNFYKLLMQSFDM